MDEISTSQLEIKYDELRLNLIGKGGFAEIYHVFYDEMVSNSLLQHLDAVLKMPLRKTDHNQREETFREAKLMASLKHENVLGVHGVCLNPDLCGIVLEYCAGSSLSHVCHKLRDVDTIPFLTLFKWCTQIANAMTFVCRTHVHADLKGENVLIKENVCYCKKRKFQYVKHNEKNYRVCLDCGGVDLNCLTMKLCDFGLSLPLDQNGHAHETRTRGTIDFMAREVLFEKKYSEKSDVYSFGILMYGITCERPMENYYKEMIILKQHFNQMKFPMKGAKNNSWESIVRPCLDAEPENRPTFKVVKTLLSACSERYELPKYDEFQNKDLRDKKAMLKAIKKQEKQVDTQIGEARLKAEYERLYAKPSKASSTKTTSVSNLFVNTIHDSLPKKVHDVGKERRSLLSVVNPHYRKQPLDAKECQIGGDYKAVETSQDEKWHNNPEFDEWYQTCSAENRPHSYINLVEEGLYVNAALDPEPYVNEPQTYVNADAFLGVANVASESVIDWTTSDAAWFCTDAETLSSSSKHNLLPKRGASDDTNHIALPSKRPRRDGSILVTIRRSFRRCRQSIYKKMQRIMPMRNRG